MIARVLSGLAIVIVLAGAAGATVDVPEVLASQSEVLLAERNTRVCTGYCVACAQTGHAASLTPPDCPSSSCPGDSNPGSGWHSTCEGGNTCGDHSCNGGEADDDAEELALGMSELHAALGAALVNEDVSALSNLLQQNPKRLHVVEARQAVQITACDGAVIAHYPMQEGLLSALQAR